MNGNEISSAPKSFRVDRIQKVVWVIRMLIGLAAVFAAAFPSIFFSGINNSTNLPPFSWHSSLHTIPAFILTLGLLRAVLFFAGAFFLDKLLRCFAHGNFFTAQNITYVKWLGCLVISDWVVVKFLAAAVSRALVIGPHDFTKLAVGFLVVLIAWLMDEGRKIQEEQASTV
jgi:Protein of unknown function (DUF2975)